MQDVRFSNISAENIIWRYTGLVAGSGLTFQNVTTLQSQWDSGGNLVRGQGIDTLVRNHEGDLQPLQVELIPTLTSDFGSVDFLGVDDRWMRAARQVCMPMSSSVHVAMQSFWIQDVCTLEYRVMVWATL